VLGRKTDEHLRPPMAKVPQKQPELLSREEITRLFACCTHPVHRMLLQTLYATGLRVSEVCACAWATSTAHQTACACA
jgi:integrase/recombinase XerD